MASAEVSVEVVAQLGPGRVDHTTLRLPAGATVADALRAAALGERLGTAALATLTPGIWGRACATATALRDGDRVELYRPLAVDPKQARRERYRRDGLRSKR